MSLCIRHIPGLMIWKTYYIIIINVYNHTATWYDCTYRDFFFLFCPAIWNHLKQNINIAMYISITQQRNVKSGAWDYRAGNSYWFIRNLKKMVPWNEADKMVLYSTTEN